MSISIFERNATIAEMAVDELITEGKAVATPWTYRDKFQCERRIVVAALTAQEPRHGRD